MQTENLFRTKMRQMRIVRIVLICVESEPNLGCVLIKKEVFWFWKYISKKPHMIKNGSPKSGLGGVAGVPCKYPQRTKEAALPPDRAELRRGIIPSPSPGSSVSPVYADGADPQLGVLKLSLSHENKETSLVGLPHKIHPEV